MASSASRVFISYARKDGAELAQRLSQDLKSHGLNPWLDIARIHGGATWTKSIEEALDSASVVLALLTAGSYISEICRAEQLRALRKGKCVIPVVAQSGADIPLHLEQKNYRDLSQRSVYSERIKELLADIQKQKGVELKEEYRETYVTAPPLPVNFVDRPESLESLRNALITDDGGRHIALTALHGMGGIGKTVLAQMLCHDPIVQQAFPDGIVWITIGKESTFDVVTRLREAGKVLNDDLTRYDNALGCMNQYRSTLRNKAALIVLDDVWNSRDVEPFRAESRRSRLLFTTRDSSIAAALGAQEHFVELLSEQQSRHVLARWSGLNEHELPFQARQLIEECGRLPLALAMIGAMLRDKPATAWSRVVNLLRSADLKKIKAQFPDYPHADLLRALQVSVDALDDRVRQRYLALAVSLEDMPLYPSIQQTLWGEDEITAAETAEQLVGLSLVQREGSEGTIKLHDLQLDFVRAQYPDKEILNLLLGALKLCPHVVLKHPAEFASQIVGRLLGSHKNPAVQPLLENISHSAPKPWLRPLWPTLYPPGTALVSSMEGHLSGIYCVAVTPDGRHALSTSRDQTIKVWDLESSQELYTLRGHTGEVISIAITPDGSRAVSSSWDHTLKVWDLEGEREIFTLRGHSGGVNCVAITPDGERAVSSSWDHTLKVWDLRSGQELLTLRGHLAGVNGLAITPDGQRVISTSKDKTLKIWNLENGQEVNTLRGHSESVNGVALLSGGRSAVSASWDHSLKLWDLEIGQELCTLRGHSDWIHTVAVVPGTRRAVSASWDQTLKVWDLENKRELRTLLGHSAGVNCVTVTPDGCYAISSSWDQTLKVWDLQRLEEQSTRQGHGYWVNGLATTPDGRLAISASRDQTLKVWDLMTGKELRILQGHSHSVACVATSPEGKRAVSGSWDKTLKVWDLESGHEECTLLGHSNTVSGVALSPDGRFAISASWDNTLKIWDLATGKEVRTLRGHTNSVNCVTVSLDGSRAISGSFDRTIKLWDLANGTELSTLRGHAGAVTGVALAPNGRCLVSAAEDKTLKVWNLDSRQEVCTLQGHTDAVNGVAVSHDGRYAVSASDDKTIRIWELENGRSLATFTCDASLLCCTCIDGKTFLAGDLVGLVHFVTLEV